MMRALFMLALLLATPAFADPLPEAERSYGPADATQHLLVRSTTDIKLFDSILNIFAALNPDLRIDYEQWGSNDLYEIGARACAGNALAADLVINSSVDQQVKLVNDGCAQPYSSAATAALDPALNWRNEVFGVTREPAVIVYNRALVPADQIPQSRFDLIDILRSDLRYTGRVATYDIEKSGLGYLFAFADSRQATTFGSLIEAFARSQAVTTCCSVEIIDGVANGTYLIAYNVLGSYALACAATDQTIAVIAPSDYTLVLSRAALIPRRAKNPAKAGAFIDFLLSAAGQHALAEQFLYLDGSELREAGMLATEVGASNLRPIHLSPVLLIGLDSQRRAHFISLWRSTFSKG